MPPLVEDLQAKALDEETSIAALLRIAMTVARKLGLSEIDDWLRQELEGYSEEATVPAYRVVYGHLKAHNPRFDGLVPAIGEDTGEPVLRRQAFCQSVAEIENLLGEGDGDLVRAVGLGGPRNKFTTYVVISKASVHGILDQVRTAVLEWGLSLEEKGITGKGLSFDAKEKRTAQASANTFVTQIFGDVGHANLQQGNVGSQQVALDATPDSLRDLAGLLREHLGNLSLDEPEEQELKAAIETIEHEADQPEVDRKVVGTTLERVKNLLVAGAAAKNLLEPVLSMLALL